MRWAATCAALEASASAVRESVPSLERLLSAPSFFALTTATPLQRAICRIATGQPLDELASHPHVRAAVGDVAALPRVAPKTILLLAGIRGAKSLISVAAATHASLDCPVNDLLPGETPRVPIVSIHRDQAKPTLEHLRGSVQVRPGLRARLIRPPTADTVRLRHASGREVEVTVTAGSRAGATLVARWLPGVVFEEAPRMVGADAGAVNLDDMLRSIHGRMRGPIWLTGSPWAPFGPVYELWREFAGRPSPDLVVIHAPAPHLNPFWWTEARQEELRRLDPLAYRTDVLAEFADAPEALIPSATIDACTRRGAAELPSELGCTYAAAIDPGTRRNAWTLIVATRRAGRTIVVLAKQWRGEEGKPLDPDAVLGQIAALLRGYRCTMVESDGWSGDALAALARRHGLELVPYADPSPTSLYLELARQMGLHQVEIPDDVHLRGDLLRAKRAVTQTGVAVHLPETSDGRHCDYFPSLARVVRAWIRDYAAPEAPEKLEEKRLEEAALRKYAPKKDVPLFRRGYR